MILKGSQRGGAINLARHLSRADQNEHVAVHKLRGISAADLRGALREIEAVSKGTRCRQYMFSLSLNPPEGEVVPVLAFEEAINRVEGALGLTGQPRAVVFHEKEGRRHAHCVWSRIDTERMRAINLPHFKRKLCDISRQLYVEHGWEMPRGLRDKNERDPLNFTRAEWQQAKRVQLDPRQIKAVFRKCWSRSERGRAVFCRLRAPLSEFVS